MKREVKVTLSPKELSEIVVDVVAKRQKLGDAPYQCNCTMTGDGELVLCFTWPLEPR
jgi:hypothetical protein